MLAADIILTLAGTYAVCGLLFAAAFVTAGVGRVDTAARGAPPAFRLLILPGSVALWPFLLARWTRASAERSKGAR
jgi:hypothetical protein